MIKTQTHIINKVIFDIDVQNQNTAHKIKQSIDSIIKEELFPRIEALLEENDLEFTDTTIVVDRFQIDVDTKSDITNVSFDIYKEFKKEFKLLINPLERNINNEVTIISNNEKQLQTVDYFLKTGNSPWWTTEELSSSTKNWEDLIEKYLSNEENIKTIQLQLLSRKFNPRILKQFSDTQLKIIFTKSFNSSSLITYLELIFEDLKTFHHSIRFFIWSVFFEKASKSENIFKVIKKLSNPTESLNTGIFNNHYLQTLIEIIFKAIDDNKVKRDSHLKNIISKSFFGKPEAVSELLNTYFKNNKEFSLYTLEEIIASLNKKPESANSKIVEYLIKTLEFYGKSIFKFKIDFKKEYSEFEEEINSHINSNSTELEKLFNSIIKKFKSSQIFQELEDTPPKKSIPNLKKNKTFLELGKQEKSKAIKKVNNLDKFKGEEKLFSQFLKAIAKENESILSENITPFTKIKEYYYVQNAGLILLHPYIKHFFEHTNLITSENEFIDKELAIHALHYVATGVENDFEHSMLFEKFLCDFPLEQPINRFVELSSTIKENVDELLKATLDNWGGLKNTSIDLFRNEFLMRNGKLILKGNSPKLIIERKTQDILLDKIPWNIGFCKLPWFKKLIFTDW